MLKYKSYYVYDFKTESIRVADGPDHDAALDWYAQATKDRFTYDDDKWAFDIALDCIRNMTDEECERIQRDGEITDYHFGYGMYVRNHYIHKSKRHRVVVADIVSDAVEDFIYTILKKEEKATK